MMIRCDGTISVPGFSETVTDLCPDQLPKCMGCEKAKAKCVDYDGITKREVPRG